MAAIGRQVNLQALNDKLSTTILTLRGALERGHQTSVWLALQADADLEAIGLTNPDDRYLLRVAVQDLQLLFDVWEGRATLSPAVDFRRYTEKLIGIDTE